MFTVTDTEFGELERKLVEQENVDLRNKLASTEKQVRDLQLETTRLFNARADDINPNVQMDRALGIPHFNYGLHQVSVQVDATRL